MKKDEARQILQALGMPAKQQSDICIYTLLGLSGIKENSSWNEVTNEFIRIHDVITFTAANYGVQYAENSRETFRKQAMHPFRLAAVIENNNKATNSPDYGYHLTDETLELLKTFETADWEKRIAQFKMNHETLISLYTHKRSHSLVPVKINNTDYTFSTGVHNELQRDIIKQFAPRFAPGAEVLYVGDTTNKYLVYEKDKLAGLGISVTEHEKLPDIILYLPDRNWVYFIEAVTSVGAISPKRVIEINEMSDKCVCERIFVTAFPNYKIFKKFADELAWDTEAWIADIPDHMIHLNGENFFSRKKPKA